METNSGSGRLRYSKQEWQRFVSEFRSGGQDCKSFCRDKGLNISRFMRWQSVFRHEAAVSADEMQPLGFMDLGTLNIPTPQRKSGILELKLDLGGGVVLTLTRN
jgi:hypothetical protein